MLLEAFGVIVWLGLVLNVANVAPPQFKVVYNPRKLIASTAKWSEKQTRRILRNFGSSKRTKARTTRRTTRTRNTSRQSFSASSGRTNYSHLDHLVFGPRLPDVACTKAHLSLTTPVTSVLDLVVRPSSALQVYEPSACPPLSLFWETSTDIDVRGSGQIHAYEPWRVATCLAFFLCQTAQCISSPQLSSGPSVLAGDDDLDWWNPWYMLLAFVFWIVVFTIAFPNPHKGKKRQTKRTKKRDSCSLCRTSLTDESSRATYYITDAATWVATISTTPVAVKDTVDTDDVVVPELFFAALMSALSMADPPLAPLGFSSHGSSSLGSSSGSSSPGSTSSGTTSSGLSFSGSSSSSFWHSHPRRSSSCLADSLSSSSSSSTHLSHRSPPSRGPATSFEDRLRGQYRIFGPSSRSTLRSSIK
ncbi:hypothetical protein PsYK624_073520 [Phanerochaete sordida]|uniref:Membrane-associated protein n=1 Tax=Phanerochaete sordida TaxID=48140 RepID=A0A9P3G8B0_9APHY|nr:hypothetical protein PsYK624_073520 [Phanerochaete sordida]